MTYTALLRLKPGFEDACIEAFDSEILSTDGFVNISATTRISASIDIPEVATASRVQALGSISQAGGLPGGRPNAVLIEHECLPGRPGSTFSCDDVEPTFSRNVEKLIHLDRELQVHLLAEVAVEQSAKRVSGTSKAFADPIISIPADSVVLVDGKETPTDQVFEIEYSANLPEPEGGTAGIVVLASIALLRRNRGWGIPRDAGECGHFYFGEDRTFVLGADSADSQL